MDLADIKSIICVRLAQLLNIDQSAIDGHAAFSSYGLDSLRATKLASELTVLLGRPVAQTVFWEYRTLESLIRHLEASATGLPPADRGAPFRPQHEFSEQAPIAVVGMSCRFPGAGDLQSYWRLLCEGRSAISPVPKGRWEAVGLPHASPEEVDRPRAEWGGFLDNIDGFDPLFFGISPREAVQMDPQQRLLLELSWEALVDAGIPADSLRESRTGVFVGALFHDYALLLDRAGAAAITPYSSTGGAGCMIANRVSYALGLMGPSMTVETASSSSLVAIHLACQSLRSGESSLALAGGVNLMLLPETTMAFSQLGVLSADGRCRAFDAAATGEVRAEGGGVVILQRLSDALRSGSPIHCIIRGTAVNNDGPSNGLTAPNPKAQRLLLAEACTAAGIAPASVQYVEAHGTATRLGDPIEAAALGAVYGAGRLPDQPLAIGSVKTNIGHLEAAAGVAGLIKTALALENGLLPPSLHFTTPNPLIDFAALRLRVVTTLQPWPASEGTPRRAGVTSFGYGGTGAHAVLESVPACRAPAAPENQEGDTEGTPPVVWIFSGQGSQWEKMGRELILSEPVFRRTLLRCDRLMRAYVDFSIFEEFQSGSQNAVGGRIDVLWPMLFAFQVALAELFRSLGLRPSMILGHSIGEVAAAQVAGALTLDSACRVICSLARLVHEEQDPGGMALAELSWDDAERHLLPYRGRVWCAIAASPKATVLAGSSAALAEVLQTFRQQGVACRRVDKAVAAHGSQMERVADRLASLLGDVRSRKSQVPLISGLRGNFIAGDELGASYWACQVRQPVRFAHGVSRCLAAAPAALFLELAPHPIVQQSIRECLLAQGGSAGDRVVAALSRRDEAGSLRQALGTLAGQGVSFRPDRMKPEEPAETSSLLPLLISASDEQALQAQARRWSEWLSGQDRLRWEDVVTSAALHRAHLTTRAALTVGGVKEAALALSELAAGRPHPAVWRGEAKPRGKVVFVFPGQGGQWEGMGRRLMEESEVFAQAVAACDEEIRKRTGWSVREVLRGDGAAGAMLERVEVVQPALFAMSVGLCAQWQAQGVEPEAVVGHSQGEIAAAYVAGILTLEEATRVVVARSQLLRRLAGRGAMAVVERPAADVQRRLLPWGATLSVAGANSPHSTIVTGERASIEGLVATLLTEGVFCRQVNTDYASHCAQVDELLPELAHELQSLKPERATIPLYSTVTGGRTEGPELDGEYWCRNLRQPVRLDLVMARLQAEGYGVFVEVSAHPVLAMPLGAVCSEVGGVVVGTLQRGDGGLGQCHQNLAKLHVSGVPVDWEKVLAPYDGALVRLPSYIFQRQRYWIDAAVAPPARTAGRLGTQPLVEPTPQAAVPSLRQQLLALAEARRKPALLARVQAEVAAVLRLPPSAQVQADKPFKGLGMDSLLAVETAGRISALLGSALPPTLLFNYATAQALTDHLYAQILGLSATVAAPPAAPVAHPEDPIAIVSMACRFPGAIATPEQLWQVLVEGREVISEFPTQRDASWRVAELYDPDPDAPGKCMTRFGGFLHDAGEFDAGFFGLSPREALAMDPQQRLLLEVSWETLERAGILPSALAGSRTGVYVGMLYSEYGSRLFAAPETLDGYISTGSFPSVASGRIAYTLGLQGPAITVDTACSSSLVAIHLACQALRSGDCDRALAGGVTVMATPAMFIESSRLRGLAPDGRCKAFADSANGTGFSEGCGVLLLERLCDAQRHGHPVLAVIRGSAINQDGRSQGLTAPNGPAQQRVIEAALRAAGLGAAEVDAVEAHGTGTSLGDPIEAHAVIAQYGAGRSEDKPLWLGSAKSNLGHTQAAAGVAGVMKMVLAMQHGKLPKTLHIDKPSRRVEWGEQKVRLLLQEQPWEGGGPVRRAAVSSFGISGTNAHLILEESPVTAAPVASPVALPLLISASDVIALRTQSRRWSDWLTGQPGIPWPDVVISAALHRTHFAARAAVSARGTEEAVQLLTELAAGRPHKAVTVGEARPRGKAVFVFPGQGHQWEEMGRSLMKESKAFAQAVAECDQEIQRQTGWSVLQVLSGDGCEGAAWIERVEVLQPVLFAMSVGLSAQWQAAGVEPEAVVGHSQGEIAAAYVAGILTLKDAVRVVVSRSRLGSRLNVRSAIVVIERSPAEVESLLGRWQGSFSVAAVNSATTTVVAGPQAAADELAALLQAENIFCRTVPTHWAAHTAHVDELLPVLREELSNLTPHLARIPFYSTVTGSPQTGPELAREYWCRNLRAPVRLDLAMECLQADGYGVFIEVSAHPVLAIPLTAACSDKGGVVVGTLQRGSGGMAQFYQGLGSLHVHGYPVDWRKCGALGGGNLVGLPTYAFQRQRYWLTAPKSVRAESAAAGLQDSAHPLLGGVTTLPDGRFLFIAVLSLSTHPWLRDHALAGEPLVPCTAFLELALAAGQRVGTPRLKTLLLQRPMMVPDRSAVRLQLWLGPVSAQGCRPFTIHGCAQAASDAPWVSHASGELTVDSENTQGWPLRSPWPPEGAVSQDLRGFYARLADAGADYGPVFQGLKELYQEGPWLYSRIALPEPAGPAAEDFLCHPALLDAALQGLVFAGQKSAEAGLLLPFELQDVKLYGRVGRELRVRMKLSEESRPDQLAAGLEIFDDSGARVADLGMVVARRTLAARARDGLNASQAPLYCIDWEAAPLGLRTESPGTWFVVGSGELADRAARALRGSGARVNRVPVLAETPRRGDGGSPAPGIVWAAATEGCIDPVTAAHAITAVLLGEVQAWAAHFAESRLVLLTQRAVSAGTMKGALDLGCAPLWGLLRTVRAEYPDRQVQLLDWDGSVDSQRLLGAALLATDQPEAVLREKGRFVPNLVRASMRELLSPDRAASAAAEPASTAERAARLPLPEGTVLISGGTGGLGARVACHLARCYGVRDFMLTSRQGMAAEGAAELVAELAALGCRTTVAACNMNDRAAVAALLSAVTRPLVAVFHLAAALDDGVLGALTPARLHAVLSPKVDGAWTLHELTRDKKLAAFVLFSSITGLVGSTGQGNYAAANTFLDALAAYRQASGLPALALAWGTWGSVGGAARLPLADQQRLLSRGLVPLTPQEGLRAMDAALFRAEPLLIPASLDLSALRRHAVGEAVPPLMRRLVQASTQPVAEAEVAAVPLARQLMNRREEDRLGLLLERVRAEAAAVLHLSAARTPLPEQPLREFGLDSLTALELRNRLGKLTSLQLPATFIFDYPTLGTISQELLKRLLGEPESAHVKEELDLNLAAAALRTATAEELQELNLLQPLRTLINRAAARARPAMTADAAPENSTLSDIFLLIDDAIAKIGGDHG